MENLYKKQVEFVSYLQRIFKEGDFTSTYKFALLHAIADICVEESVSNDATFVIPLDKLVDKFILLYWNHTEPFLPDSKDKDEGIILLQNAKKQVSVIANVYELKKLGANNLKQAKRLEIWPVIYKKVLNTIKEGPLWRLQKLLKKDACYLYPHIKNRNYIELNRGIASCFRQFHDLVVKLTRQCWTEKVTKLKINQSVIGKAGELEGFLFGENRTSLKSAVKPLMDMQNGVCFYCHKPITSNPEVDHFIPFKMYSNDLAHNFVLSHSACNNNKRDYLAAPSHRERWEDQNLVNYKKFILDELEPYYLCDSERAEQVAVWAYEKAIDSGSRFWLAKPNVFVDHSY